MSALDDLGPLIERYLLGQVSPAERRRLEERLFEDDDLLPAIRDGEDRLMDRYLEGELSAEHREAFLRHFAASPLRQEQIALRRVLPRVLSEPADAAARAPAPPPPRPARARPWWAGLAALLSVAVLWLERGPMLAPDRPPLPSRSTAPAASPAVPSTPEAPALPREPALVLRPGLLRSGGHLPTISPPLPDPVRLDLELVGNPAPAYSASLRTVEAAPSWKARIDVRPGERRVRVLIPTTVLSPGEYVLTLTTPGQTEEDGASYVFRVTAGTGRR